MATTYQDLRRLATTATPGAMPATDKAKMDTLAGGSWSDKMLIQANAVLTAAGVGLLTEFDSVRPGLYPTATPALAAGVTDAQVNGMMFSVYPGTPIFTTIALSGVVMVNPNTGRFAVGFRGIFPSPQTYPDLTSFGIMDVAKAKFCWMYSYANQSATNLALQCAPTAGGGAVVTTSHVLDGAEHDYLLVFDGTNAHAVVDGTDVGQVVLSGGPTTASTISVACLRATDTAPYLRIRRFGFGY